MLPVSDDLDELHRHLEPIRASQFLLEAELDRRSAGLRATRLRRADDLTGPGRAFSDRQDLCGPHPILLATIGLRPLFTTLALAASLLLTVTAARRLRRRSGTTAWHFSAAMALKGPDTALPWAVGGVTRPARDSCASAQRETKSKPTACRRTRVERSLVLIHHDSLTSTSRPGPIPCQFDIHAQGHRRGTVQRISSGARR